MKIRLGLFLAIAAAAAQPALAQTTVHNDSSVKVSPGEAHYSSKANAVATVTMVNHQTRELHLRMDDGRNVSLTAGPEIKKFAMIKVGDKVRADYEELVSVKLLKGAKQPLGWRSTSATHRAEGAGPPAGGATETDTLVANITKIDKAKSTVTLQGAAHSIDVQIEDPNQLKLMKVGGQLELTIKRTLNLSVEPVAK
jgi:hypothetical protein